MPQASVPLKGTEAPGSFVGGEARVGSDRGYGKAPAPGPINAGEMGRHRPKRVVVVVQSQPQLLDVVRALHPVGRLADLLNGRQE